MTARRWIAKLRMRWPQVLLVCLLLCFLSRDLWYWMHGYPCGDQVVNPLIRHRPVRKASGVFSPTPDTHISKLDHYVEKSIVPHISAHSPVKLTRIKSRSSNKSRKGHPNPKNKAKILQSNASPSNSSKSSHLRAAAKAVRRSSLHSNQTAAKGNVTTVKLPKRNATEEKLPLETVFLKKLQRSRKVRGLPVPSMRDSKTCSPSLDVNAPCIDLDCAATWNGSRDLGTFRQFMQEQPQVPEKYMDAISEMGRADNSRRYQLMIMMAVSSNHFYEVQALLHNLHTLLLPALASVDHVIVLYDLGMTPEERKLMTKYCKCQVRSFSLTAFPPKLRDLHCYAWKPLLIAANLPHTQHLLWLDASVRFISDNLTPILTELEESGFLLSRSCWGLAYNVHPSMLEFYRMPQVCALSDFFEWEANLLAFASTKLTMATILGPWLACTFSPNCMCPPGHEKYFKSPPYRAYSKCHRFDQSSLNMILLRLYGDKMPLLTFPRYIYHTIKRSTTMHYFPEEPKKKH